MPADLHQCFCLSPGDLPSAAVLLGRAAAMRAMQGRAEHVLEAELMSSEAGAVTETGEAGPGQLMAVEGGEPFLDEIGEVDLDLQRKLLFLIRGDLDFRIGGAAEWRARAQSASCHAAAKVKILRVLKGNRASWRKKAGELKRGCRTTLYRFRIADGFKRRKSRSRFPRPGHVIEVIHVMDRGAGNHEKLPGWDGKAGTLASC